MGKLLSLLARDDSNCCTPKTYDVFLDFENAAPTETEREIYDEVERVLRESDTVLDEIQCYKVSSVSVWGRCVCVCRARSAGQAIDKTHRSLAGKEQHIHTHTNTQRRGGGFDCTLLHTPLVRTCSLYNTKPHKHTHTRAREQHNVRQAREIYLCR